MEQKKKKKCVAMHDNHGTPILLTTFGCPSHIVPIQSCTCYIGISVHASAAGTVCYYHNASTAAVPIHV